MSAKQHFVSLSEDERAQVERAVHSSKNPVGERVRARLLLAAGDPAGWTDKQVAEQAGASGLTVWRVRQRFAARGLEGALHHTEQAKRKERRLDGPGRGAPGGPGVLGSARGPQGLEPAPACGQAGGG